MSARARLAVVGATGVTGSRVARHAGEFGVDTVLVGRDRAALDALAARTGARDTRTVDLTDAASVRAALDGSTAVANCVAPSTSWGLPIARAAVDLGIDYLDTTGEAAYCMTLIEQLDAPAREKGARLLPAVGTSSLPADFAAARALARVDAGRATALSLGYQLKGFQASAGTIRSEIDILADGTPYVSGGRLRLGPPGGSTRRLPHGLGVRMPVPDAVVISRYCDLPEIESFLIVPAPGLVGPVLRGLARLCAGGRARPRLNRLAERLPDSDDGSEHGSFTVHATVWGPWGAHTTTVSGSEVYRSTARYVVMVAAALAERPGPGGVTAPSRVVGDVEAAAKAVDLAVDHTAHRPADQLTV